MKNLAVLVVLVLGHYGHEGQGPQIVVLVIEGRPANMKLWIALQQTCVAEQARGIEDALNSPNPLSR